MKRYLLPLLFCATQLNAQPVLVKDINPGIASGSPYGITDFNGKLVFAANDGTNGTQLWVTDNNDTYMLSSSEPAIFTPSILNKTYKKCVVGNDLYFAASSFNTGLELYRWNGGNYLELLFDFAGPSGHPGLSPANLCTANGDVYFTGLNENYERRLWTYSTLNSTTSPVTSVDPSFHTDGEIGQLTAVDSVLYFASYFTENGIATIEAFRYNPATKTLTRTGDIGATYFPENFIQLNDRVYFINNTVSGAELWAWDGLHQPAKASTLVDIDAMTVHQGKLYFEACYSLYDPHYLFSLDPINNDVTHIPTAIGFNGIMDSRMAVYNNRLFFCADNLLWSVNGIEAPTPLFDPRLKLNGQEMCVSHGILYITGASDATGDELFAYYEAPTSVNTLTQQIPISIYPNPTTSSWNFDLSSFKDNDLQLIITDVTGRVVSKQKVNNNNKISATAPAPGTYLYYVTDNMGTAIQSGKLQRL